MKVPFQIVNDQVNKMYLVDMTNMTDEEAQLIHIKIKDFVIACGWTTKEFVKELFGFKKSN